MTPRWSPSRREFLGAAGLALLGVACTGGSNDVQPTAPATSGPAGAPGSIDDLSKGAQQLSLIGSPGADAGDAANPGTFRYGFALTTSTPSLVAGGGPQVFVATDQTSTAQGPFVATWYPMNGYQETGDTSPKSPLAAGVYVAQVNIAQEGNWVVAAVAQAGSQRGVGAAAIAVTTTPVQHAIGTKAVSTPTPVATSDDAIAQICTRTPVCHLHGISLAKALANGKPTAVSFATPLLCTSQLCGPVVDEMIVASQSVGAKANFIHVEEFLPGPSLSPPPPSLEAQSPAFKAWKLESEPWTYVIDRSGVIRFRAQGPVAAAEIEAALQPLV